MRPTQRWTQMVLEEHAQTEKLWQEPPPSDHWVPYAHQFRDDPRRSGDPLLEIISRHVAPTHTVIDAGAGAGRLALPLALRCQHVVAVEPSPSMAALLLESAEEHSIKNISLVESTWEEAQLEPGDVALCSHVLYVAKEIRPFVRKLEANARERVLVVLFDAPPQSHVYPLWELVHGEERLRLPSLPEFLEVLEELGIEPTVEKLPSVWSGTFETQEQALGFLTGRLYLSPGDEKHRLLESALPGLLEDVEGRLKVRGTRRRTESVVSWKPSAS